MNITKISCYEKEAHDMFPPREIMKERKLWIWEEDECCWMNRQSTGSVREMQPCWVTPDDGYIAHKSVQY